MAGIPDSRRKTTGFREHVWNKAQGIKPGDVFLCYLVGVKRWVGLLEVSSERFKDDSPIYAEEIFPVRFSVRSLAILSPEHGVPMESLAGKLTFFPPDATGKKWSGRVRGSPSRYKLEDGEVITAAIREASANPISRQVDAKQLARPANLYKLKGGSGSEEIETVVSIPAKEEEEQTVDLPSVGEEGPTHAEIQWRLLDLGSQMGLNVWAPRADRGKTWNSKALGGVPKMLASLPNQFNEATTKTIENIDVLWLSGQSIVAAFEVEHTTVVYSGLLRMSDLLTMQPNLNVNLYLVGPDNRYEKFVREVARPTFASRLKPLHSVCGFLPYSRLCERLKEATNVIRFLKPEFVDELADFYDPADDVD